MSQTLTQHVVVQPDGRIVIYLPQWKPGTHAEVTVVESPASGGDSRGETVKLSSLIGSCPGMFASPAEADAFFAQERNAWDL